MSKSILSMTLACQLMIAVYLTGHLDETHASHFEKPLDMSKLCAATICQDDVSEVDAQRDTMIVSNRMSYQGNQR